MLMSNLEHKSIIKSQIFILNYKMLKRIRKSLQTSSDKTYHFYKKATIYLLKHKGEFCYF